MTEREYLEAEIIRLREWFNEVLGTMPYDKIMADYRYIRLNEIIERLRVIDTPAVEIITEEGS